MHIHLTDEELVQQVRASSTDAFTCLVKRYQSVVYGLAYHLVGNFADAQDIAQDVFLEAYQSLERLEQPAKFANWLRGITINLCRMWQRKQRTLPISLEDDLRELALTLPSHEPSPLDELIDQEFHDSVAKAMLSLPEDNRLVLTLYYFNEMSYKEISQFLDIPLTTVEGRLYRTKKQMQFEITKNRSQNCKWGDNTLGI